MDETQKVVKAPKLRGITNSESGVYLASLKVRTQFFNYFVLFKRKAEYGFKKEFIYEKKKSSKH